MNFGGEFLGGEEGGLKHGKKRPKNPREEFAEAIR